MDLNDLDQRRSRNFSYLCAVTTEKTEDQTLLLSSEVKAGMQKVLQVFITNSANVFLLEPNNNGQCLDEQVGDALPGLKSTK